MKMIDVIRTVDGKRNKLFCNNNNNKLVDLTRKSLLLDVGTELYKHLH